MIAHLAAALSSRNISTRLEAIEELLEAAEANTDLTAALGALGRALSDVDASIRERAGQVLGYWSRAGGAPGDAVAGLVAALGDRQLALVVGECLRDALSGADAPAIRAALEEAALGGEPLQSRGAAGLLMRGRLLSETPQRAADLLTSSLARIREGACESAVSAARDGIDVSVLMSVLDPLLQEASSSGVADHVAWLVIRTEPSRTAELLAHPDDAVRLGTLTALAEFCDAGEPPQAAHEPLWACLAHPVVEIRLKAVGVFVAMARAGLPLSDSVSVLGAALSDAAPDVRHEAVQALLWMARSGQNLEAAGIGAVLASGGVRLRKAAAMAWGWHLLSHGTAEDAAALLVSPDRHVRFGGAWGMTERHLSRHDAGALLDLLVHPDQMIGEVVVATMRQLRGDGHRVSAGLTALHLLQQGGLVDGGRAGALFAEFLRESGR
ncbi:MAG: hypothetical protein ACI8RZ_004207 [Myxococcota bacterium]